MPTITPLPSPPSTSDPANFSSKADAHILAQHVWTDQVNAFAADLAGAGIVTPTRDSLVVNATTTDLWSNSKIQDWTGTATVTDFPDAPSEGSQRVAYPVAGTIIANNANISVQGSANYTIASGDEVTITAVTVSTFYASIKRKDGLPVVPPVISSKIQSVSSSVAANALTLNYNGGVLDFRNASLTSGAPVTLPVAANSIVIPSGATLGTINAIQARLVLLEAYNGGSPVLCVANLAGGLQLDETNLISPTTISAASTANNVIYSASVVAAGSPYRVVGFVDITESASGTWVTDATLKQGIGGQALAALSSSGFGQSIQTVTRTNGTTYYNTTGKEITLHVIVSGAAGATNVITVDGKNVYSFSTTATGTTVNTGVVKIPPGASYIVAGNTVPVVVYELR